MIAKKTRKIPMTLISPMGRESMRAVANRGIKYHLMPLGMPIREIKYMTFEDQPSN
jgi:hypothetical protein